MLADRLGFVLHYEIMREGIDVDQSVPLSRGAEETPDRGAVGFDRGFHSPEYRKRLEELLDCAALPKKGRRARKTRRQRGPKFAEMRRMHLVANRG